jgi:hypothetical protein
VVEAASLLEVEGDEPENYKRNLFSSGIFRMNKQKTNMFKIN